MMSEEGKRGSKSERERRKERIRSTTIIHESYLSACHGDHSFKKPNAQRSHDLKMMRLVASAAGNASAATDHQVSLTVLLASVSGLSA